jgi:uncharacterized membrane protein
VLITDDAKVEELFKEVAGYIALGVEVIAALVIACGAGQAVFGLLRRTRPDRLRPFADKKAVWQRFGVWLLLGLEFELAADIVRSAIAPTWEQIGQLASIAVIRTFLNYFLEKDLEKSAERAEEEAVHLSSRPAEVGAD